MKKKIKIKINDELFAEKLDRFFLTDILSIEGTIKGKGGKILYETSKDERMCVCWECKSMWIEKKNENGLCPYCDWKSRARCKNIRVENIFGSYIIEECCKQGELMNEVKKD